MITGVFRGRGSLSGDGAIEPTCGTGDSSLAGGVLKDSSSFWSAEVRLRAILYGAQPTVISSRIGTCYVRWKV